MAQTSCSDRLWEGDGFIAGMPQTSCSDRLWVGEGFIAGMTQTSCSDRLNTLITVVTQLFGYCKDTHTYTRAHTMLPCIYDVYMSKHIFSLNYGIVLH